MDDDKPHNREYNLRYGHTKALASNYLLERLRNVCDIACLCCIGAVGGHGQGLHLLVASQLPVKISCQRLMHNIRLRRAAVGCPCHNLVSLLTAACATA